MGRKFGADPRPFGEGERGPYLTQSRLGRDLPPCQVPASFIQPFGHNKYGPKIWGLCPPFGEGGAGSPSNTVAWAEAYLHTKWYRDLCSHLAATDMGRKLGGGCAPLVEGSWVPI